MGSFLLYYLFIYPLASLPLYINQKLAYVMYLLLFYGMRYRRKVVFNNLQLSFPEKSTTEINKLSKAFYKHLCQLVGESVKNFTITEKQARKRLTIENIEVIDKYFEQGKSIISIGGHYGNWELFALTVDMLAKHKHAALYTSIKDKFFDKKMRSTRSKYGTDMISLREIQPYIEKNNKTPVSIVFAADQWPPGTKKAHWTNFLNRETPFYRGAEKLARKYNMPVIYGEILKLKTGHYKVVYHEITDDPSKLKEGEIIDRYAQLLEQTIKTKNPSHWLWSHKRWKRTKEEVFKS